MERRHRLTGVPVHNAFSFPATAHLVPPVQNTIRRWHRAKHSGWHTSKLPYATIRWTCPSGRSYDRHPKRIAPPDVPDGTRLPPLPD